MPASTTGAQSRQQELAAGVFAHPSGGLWLPAMATLIVASIPQVEDLEGGPRPELIVAVGDPDTLKSYRINALSAIFPVTGDPEAWRRTGLQTWPEWRGGGLWVTPRMPDLSTGGVLVVPGGYHPVVSVGDAASTKQRLPAYLVYSKAILIPGPAGSATSFDIGRGLPPALAPLADSGVAEAFALRRGEVLPLGKLRLKARQVRAKSA
ncbi:MAG: hypothetical protein KJZ79_19030 [Bryobacteraceae bacterium]|nr:hypothetical protein [Bryobacteraceae bacterium]